jgi:hypothetical protein
MKNIRQMAAIAAICAFLAATPSFAAAQTAYAQIPAGTVVSVRMIDSISSERNDPGQVFRGWLAAPVRLNHSVVLPQGSTAFVRLVNVERAGDIKGRDELTLQLDRIVTPKGVAYPVHSYIVEFRGHSQGKRTAKSAGIGGAIGGGVGALLGGGTGALVGGTVGAGAGVLHEATKSKRPIFIGSESLVNFRLAQPIPLR